VTIPRSVSVAVWAQLSKRITKPGYLVIIAFPSPLFLSSRGALVWNEIQFSDMAMDISGLGALNNTVGTGSITLLDVDQFLTNLVITVTVVERGVAIFQIADDAPEYADPVLIFQGITDGMTVDMSRGSITLDLIPSMSRTFSPRYYCAAETGMNWVPPNGTIITWGSEKITIERR